MTLAVDVAEERLRQKILNSLNNRDYLMLMAHQQNKLVAQVRYELIERLVGRRF